VRDEAELRGHHHLVASALQRLPDKLFVDIRPVDLRGIDEGHAEFERAVDGPDGLGVVAAGPGVSERHPHCTQAYT
jgi:hypothetical protein